MLKPTSFGRARRLPLREPAMSDQAIKPFWASTSITDRHDIALLRPKTLSKGERFETQVDAVGYSESLEESLRENNRGHEVAEFLGDCRLGYYTCSKPYCPLCARSFRRW